MSDGLFDDQGGVPEDFRNPRILLELSIEPTSPIRSHSLPAIRDLLDRLCRPHGIILKPVTLPADPPVAPFSPRAPKSSERAAQLVAPAAGSQARTVLSIMRRRHPTPITVYGLVDAVREHHPDISHNQVAARLNGLRHGGWVDWVYDADGEIRTVITHGRYTAGLQHLTAKALALPPA